MTQGIIFVHSLSYFQIKSLLIYLVQNDAQNALNDPVAFATQPVCHNRSISCTCLECLQHT